MDDKGIIKELKTKIKSLEQKIKGSIINQKYLDADRNRSFWHSEFRRVESEKKELEEILDEKQLLIDMLKEKWFELSEVLK